MRQYGFEKLEIWQLSVDSTVQIYKLTKDFPPEEKFGIISQIRRASNSVSANIAEGYARLTKKEKARFLQIAYGSLMEVLSFLIVSEKLGFLENRVLLEQREVIEKLSNKINAYHKKIL